jgi:hypothetical protein
LAVTHVCPKQAFPEQTCGFGLAPWTCELQRTSSFDPSNGRGWPAVWVLVKEQWLIGELVLNLLVINAMVTCHAAFVWTTHLVDYIIQFNCSRN